MQAYFPLVAYITIAVAIPVLISVVIGLLGPSKPNATKLMAYESGHPTTPMMGRFPQKFYLVAMLFVIFDVEAASFYPWAVQLKSLGVFGLYEMIAFVLVLAIGYAYVWKKGGFSWR